ncbi:unnamed protein product [Durusdinium trenchii]|uniref:ABC transporter domain-containing protein n=1 Tax=Durusdinium trenchii TaxID=1381693 RepID=A0ABP0PR51_9DINO
MGRKPDPKKKEAKAASKKKNGYADKGENQRMSAESIGFQIRTGPEAPSKTGASMDIDVNEIVVFAGKQELLFNATLRLAQGIKYGLIGRNGVGKSTLLRAMAERDGLGPPSIGRARRSQGTPVSVPCRTPFCRGRGGWVNPPAAGASVVLSRC